MGQEPRELQQSDTAPLPMPDSGKDIARYGFSELDLALVDALQTGPRAPWSRIGRVLGVDPTTASRRWERMRDAGLAWITTHSSTKTITLAHVEVRCRSRYLASVSAAVARLPWVISVDETAGDFDFYLGVAATDLATLGRSVRETIGGLRGVRALRVSVGITHYSEGSQWRTRAMAPGARAALLSPPSSSRFAFSSQPYDLLASGDRALVSALSGDGRSGYTELAAMTGMSEHTARRRLQRMVREGDIVFRCDLAHRLAGLSTAMIYRASVPHSLLDKTGTALARMEPMRLCISQSGPHNLLMKVWMRGLDAVDQFETLLSDRFPALEVKDRTVVFHSAKRMDRLLDVDGRAIGRVPIQDPLPPLAAADEARFSVTD
ncbi:Lrp/AsnC family transcriptional regulator [Streptomyces sp. NPDC048636]|uniref:Lrp/AsnC family transcriptional regulator n=1 Tax=Streptomyces sp. NPDC048636 TaxID=3155762 RepID=UPI003423D7C0